MDLIVFYIFAGLAVLASIGVVAQRNPMHSVLLLIVSFGGLADLFLIDTRSRRMPAGARASIFAP